MYFSFASAFITYYKIAAEMKTSGIDALSTVNIEIKCLAYCLYFCYSWLYSHLYLICRSYFDDYVGDKTCICGIRFDNCIITSNSETCSAKACNCVACGSEVRFNIVYIMLIFSFFWAAF